ncbi:MAG: hypothetical protein ABI540_07250 [Spartobacteria bacterium]
MKIASVLSPLQAWLRRSRCKWMLVMTALCLILRENYPFSNFPMYSSFNNRTYFLYLTDAEGEAIQTRQFGLSSSGLKKIFDRYRRRELDRFKRSGSERVRLAEEAAGESLVRYLEGLSAGRPVAHKLVAGLRVQHVQVRQREGALRFETRQVAQHP